jgi:hypothetical protein
MNSHAFMGHIHEFVFLAVGQKSVAATMILDFHTFFHSFFPLSRNRIHCSNPNSNLNSNPNSNPNPNLSYLGIGRMALL